MGHGSASRLRKRGDRLYDALFITPQLVLYLGFTIIPFLIAIPLVLTDRRDFMDNEVAFIGFQNFITIFQQPFLGDFMAALGRTVVFTLANYAMVFVFGLTLALVMFEYTWGLKRPFFTIIYMPFMISGIGAGMLLTLLFSRDSGSLNLLFLHLGLLQEPIDLKSPEVTAFLLPVMTGWRYAGVNLAFFLSGLLSIPTDNLEAAKVDGATYRQRLWHIYLPQIVPSIIIATVTCLIGSFNLIDELIGLGAMYGNQNAVFISVLVFQKGFTSGLAQSVAMSLVVFVPLIIVAFLLIQWQKKKQY